MIVTNTDDIPIGRKIMETSRDVGSNRVDIASAFFSNAVFINDLIENYDINDIRLIIRLNDGTNPDSLTGFVNNPNIQVRFFKDTTFHPKFYILKNNNELKTAFLGSANCSNPGLRYGGQGNNVEVMAEVDSNDLETLSEVFESYWNDAWPLTTLALQEFKDAAGDDWRGRRGNGYGDNVQINNQLIEYMQRYQNWSYKFNQIKERYNELFGNNRKIPDVPLSIEIDTFLSYFYTRNNLHNIEVDNLEQYEFREDEFNVDIGIWDNLNIDDIIGQYDTLGRYSRINQGLSAEQLDVDNELNEEDLFAVIQELHSVDHHLTQDAFFAANDLGSVKNNLSYLLYGDDDEVNRYQRMYDLINDDNRRIIYLGVSRIQELVGWIWCQDENQDNFLILNERSMTAINFYNNVQ